MSRTANADEFRNRLQRIGGQYRHVFKPQLQRLEEALDSGALARSALVDESTEVHERAYFVNALLNALNWRMDVEPDVGLPNLVPETGVRSMARGTKRFLDYFGMDCAGSRPLLVVETKRPSTLLPRLKPSRGDTTVADTIARGLRGESIGGDWDKWLRDDVGDYVRSIHVVLAVRDNQAEFVQACGAREHEAVVSVERPDPGDLV